MSRESLIQEYLDALPPPVVASRTSSELRAKAQRAIDRATAKVDFLRQSGNSRAIGMHPDCIERRIAAIVRNIAAGWTTA